MLRWLAPRINGTIRRQIRPFLQQYPSLGLDDFRQEAMLAAVRAYYRWRPNNAASLRTWCYGRAMGAITDLVRTVTHRGKAPETSSIDIPTGEDGMTVGDLVTATLDPKLEAIEDRDAAALARPHLRAAINRLPERDRLIFALRASGGTLKGIGERVGLTEQGVAARLRSVYARLRDDPDIQAAWRALRS
jgi:RNA polymerase sigma factor (sigma-70 family)